MSAKSDDIAKQEERVRQAKLRLSVRAPFFGALIQHSDDRLLPDDRPLPEDFAQENDEGWSGAGAVTDGKTIYMKAGHTSRLSDPELEGLLLHGLIHQAYLHAPRRGNRDAARYEIAADIVANAVVAKMDGPELPAGAVRAPSIEDRTVEAIYSIIGQSPKELSFHGRENDPPDQLPGVHLLISEPDGENSLWSKWSRALRRARSISERARGQGDLPAHLEREFDEVVGSQIDWRAVLWQHVRASRSDYSGIDRRKVYRGLYVRELSVQELRIKVCVDTSGSIRKPELSAFIAELRTILHSYERVDATLWYSDADLSGPYELRPRGEIPEPVGGGGTDFRPFFEEALRQDPLCGGSRAIILYLTDGYGNFPSEEPPVPPLWLVPVGGRPAEEFPFGKVVRLEI